MFSYEFKGKKCILLRPATTGDGREMPADQEYVLTGYFNVFIFTKAGKIHFHFGLAKPDSTDENADQFYADADDITLLT